MHDDEADRRTAEVTAMWDSFADSLKRIGRQAIAAAPNEADQLDAVRFVLRQLAYREEQFLEFPRGARAEVFLPESPTRKIFADCPDTLYRQFNVIADGIYTVEGTVGDAAYVSFTAYRSAVSDRVVADLHDGELDIDRDGRFTLTIGGPELEGNWLDLGDDGAFVIIREYRHDRDGGAMGEFAVTQVSPEPGPRDELRFETLAAALGIIGMGLEFSNDATVRLSESLRAEPNVMSDAAGDLVSEMAGTPHNHYQLATVRLGSGERLELELDPPDSRYWSVHLNNYWLESPEFRDGQRVCINDAQSGARRRRRHPHRRRPRRPRNAELARHQGTQRGRAPGPVPAARRAAPSDHDPPRPGLKGCLSGGERWSTGHPPCESGARSSHRPLAPQRARCSRNASSSAASCGPVSRPTLAPIRSIATERTCSACAFESRARPASSASSKTWNG